MTDLCGKCVASCADIAASLRERPEDWSVYSDGLYNAALKIWIVMWPNTVRFACIHSQDLGPYAKFPDNWSRVIHGLAWRIHDAQRPPENGPKERVWKS